MQFPDFLKILPNLQKQQLTATASHIKMAPAERVQSLSAEFYSKRNPKLSAVMMLFYPRHGETNLVLIRRNTYPGVHSAQISFPGGRVEPEDESLAATALRETCEEIGVTATEVDIIMPFSEIYIPPSNFLVYPFLGVSVEAPVFNPDPTEVAAIVELPLKSFLDDTIITELEMQTSYSAKIKVPGFKAGDDFVWGATAMIMSELKDAIKSVI